MVITITGQRCADRRVGEHRVVHIGRTIAMCPTGAMTIVGAMTTDGPMTSTITKTAAGDQIMKIRLFVSGIVAALLLVAPTVALPQGTPHSKMASPSTQAFEHRIEQRIKRLHEELKITSDEQPQWDAVAHAMREDAEKVGALIRERREKEATMNAVEDLRTYQAIAEAHAEALEKITSAFEELYEVMSPAQQKIADQVFAKRMHRRPVRKGAK